MNPEIKARWIAYLEDGTRTQGRKILRNEHGDQCCLDVLCEIAVEDGIINPPHFSPVRNCYVYEGTNDPGTGYFPTWDEASLLPHVVAEWAGLDSANPSVTVTATDSFVEEFGLHGDFFNVRSEAVTVRLSECNDNLEMNFRAIADCIRNSL
jgi:hypothetical protein